MSFFPLLNGGLKYECSVIWLGWQPEEISAIQLFTVICGIRENSDSVGFKMLLVVVKLLAFSARTLFLHLSTPYLNVQLNHSTSNGCWELKRLHV